MKFDTFCKNVESWSEARGIYEHSTALAQALKAVSEVGELADAAIKGDTDALADAIGDVAVCLVNVAKMRGEPLDLMTFDKGEPVHAGLHEQTAFVAYHVSDLASDLVYSPLTLIEHNASHAFACMGDIAGVLGLTLEACCEAAWDEIKDRSGRMVAGGAFVKDETQ